jgi:Flp pilus assembly pilin Flp
LTASGVTAGSTLYGGVLSYWTNSGATTALANPNSVTASGTYYIKVMNTAGCMDIKPVVVTINPKPILSITNPAAVCAPLTVDLTASGVTAGSTLYGGVLSYWTNSGATTALANPNSVTASGTYYIKVINTAGCMDIKPVLVVIKSCGSIGDFVWNDLNSNGTQDIGEPGISGVKVTLSGCGVSMDTTTDSNGLYLFTNLIPCDNYCVTFVTPIGYVASPSNIGDDTKDSDPIGGTACISLLAISETNLTVDAGFYIPAMEGCTLGYWKNHTDRWCDAYRTCDRFGDVFSNAPTNLANLTLLEALNLGGGGIYNLARQGVAALLNTCSDEVRYPAPYGSNSQMLINAINAAYLAGDKAAGTLASQLDILNNSGCPLGGTEANNGENCSTADAAGKTTTNTETAVFTASPVPFKDQLTIRYDFDYVSNVKIEVFNAQGGKVHSQLDNNSYLNKEVVLNLNIKRDQEQVYIVKLTTDRGSSTKKVMSSKK